MSYWLHKIAFYLFPYRKCLLFIASGFFIGLVYALTVIVVQDRYSIPSLLALLWSLLLFVIVTVYHREIKITSEDQSFLTKCKMKIQQGLLFLLSSSLLILMAISAYLTIKLFTL
jgi:hypothetical protein